MKNISMVCFKLYDKNDLLFAEIIDFDPPEDVRVIFFAAKARKILGQFLRKNPGEKISRIEVKATLPEATAMTFSIDEDGNLQAEIAKTGDAEQ